MQFSFEDNDAINHDVDSAVLIARLKSLFRKSFYEKKHVHDGIAWTPLSASELKFLFPFWSKKHIQELMQRLVSKRILKKKRLYKFSRNCCFAFVRERDLV